MFCHPDRAEWARIADIIVACWGFAIFGFIKLYEAMCREEGATQTGSYSRSVCVMEAGQDCRVFIAVFMVEAVLNGHIALL